MFGFHPPQETQVSLDIFCFETLQSFGQTHLNHQTNKLWHMSVLREKIWPIDSSSCERSHFSPGQKLRHVRLVIKVFLDLRKWVHIVASFLWDQQIKTARFDPQKKSHLSAVSLALWRPTCVASTLAWRWGVVFIRFNLSRLGMQVPVLGWGFSVAIKPDPPLPRRSPWSITLAARVSAANLKVVTAFFALCPFVSGRCLSTNKKWQKIHSTDLSRKGTSQFKWAYCSTQ